MLGDPATHPSFARKRESRSISPCHEPAFDKSGVFPIIDEGHGERLAG